MYSRLLKVKKRKSLFLFGPRGTGKSTWVKYNFPDAIYLDLLESDIYTGLLAQPGSLENFIPPKFQNYIIIDEIQRVPELLNEVHRLIESKSYKFIMLGSSARKLRSKGINLLAGRALSYFMFPLTVKELGDDFKLPRSLKFGHLPMAYTDPEPERYLKSFVKTYLREEIMQEGLTRNLGAFSRFLEAASFSQGSILNITEVARECGVHRKVVENYFSILQDLLIADLIPVFTKKAKRRMTAHPKFYFFDVGVFRSIRPIGPLDMPEQAEGAAFETLFFQELRAVNNYYDMGYDIYYWRTSNNIEVDFVLYGKGGIMAFEIKRSRKYKMKDLNGLKLFLKDYPIAKAFFVYGGDKVLYVNDICLMPYEECIKKLISILQNEE
jgi:predicted AAA+ superfamily ATPase